MTKFMLPLLLIGAAAPALAASVDQPAQIAVRPISFERDGIRYVATVKTVGTATLISGYEVDSGKGFELRSQNGHVSGTYGLSTVNYVVGR